MMNDDAREAGLRKVFAAAAACMPPGAADQKTVTFLLRRLDEARAERDALATLVRELRDRLCHDWRCPAYSDCDCTCGLADLLARAATLLAPTSATDAS